jgi:D-aminoacyl-tRNA deacylase
MRVVIQRVKTGQVSVDGRQVAQIGPGMVILLGIGQEDCQAQVGEERIQYLIEKTATLRIFEDEFGKINRSILDIGGAAIVVSQFTLYADTRKGRRPSFTDAALPDVARSFVDRFVGQLNARGVPTQAGEFGAHMLVEIANDGPVTIVLSTP